jgi:ectoine hydroxylase-related dioxygenase (phytanoyl-CoA dioxygenase family)
VTPKLSADDVSLFHAQGWLRLGRIASPEQVAELVREERRFRLGRGYGAAHNDTLRVNVQLCDRSEPVRRFCTSGPHVGALTALIGPNVCLTHQQFVTKLPDTGELRSDIPMHQDGGYGELEPATDVTIWLPLVDTDARNGALYVVPGSHALGRVEHASAAVNPALREARGGEPVLVPLAAGEAIAFSGLLLHGSGPNRSDRERPAMYARYCEPHTRMLSEGGRSVLDDPRSWMVAGEA